MATKRSKPAKAVKETKRTNTMAESKEGTGNNETPRIEPAQQQSASAPPTSQSVNFQLLAANGSDQPFFANVTLVQPTAAVALVDFGFLDPATLSALSSMANAGRKVPERINGRLAARLALSYDALNTLHQQIGAVLQAVSRQARRSA
jgi:hypothetical protein